MTMETILGLICLIPAVIYFLVNEINWKYIWKVIKKWISL